jgi:hypothetical protein
VIIPAGGYKNNSKQIKKGFMWLVYEELSRGNRYYTVETGANLGYLSFPT